MPKKYYLAYGSNLNVDQMEHRCPGAKIVGEGTLKDWRLRFRGSGSGAYLTIEPCKGSTVPVGVWEITDQDERALDCYEGYPKFYYKRVFSLRIFSYRTQRREDIDALIYIMQPGRPLGLPNGVYVQTCAQGYIDFRFDMKPLLTAVKLARKEAV